MKEAIYKAKCEKAWDGDSFGNEWTCGASVHKSTDPDEPGFSVFEDDGKGNGNHLATLVSEDSAKQYADLYCKWLDAGGYADNPLMSEMARLADEKLTARAAERHASLG